MKTIKIKFIVTFAALMGLANLEIKAQTGALNYKVNRTIAEIRDTVRETKSPFYANLRNAYIDIINEGLVEGNFNLIVEARDMGWILDNSVIVDESFVNSTEYENGIRYGNEIRFQNLQGQVSKYLAFVYKGHYIIYAKIACGNPYKKKHVPKPPPPPAVPPPSKPDTVIKFRDRPVATTKSPIKPKEPCGYWGKEMRPTGRQILKSYYYPGAQGDYTGSYDMNGRTVSYLEDEYKEFDVWIPCEQTRKPAVAGRSSDRNVASNTNTNKNTNVNLTLAIGSLTFGDGGTTDGTTLGGFTAVTPGGQTGGVIVTPAGQGTTFVPVTPRGGLW